MQNLIKSALERPEVIPSRQEPSTAPARVIVVGVGGAGCNTMSRLSSIGISGAELVAVNTDKLHLDSIDVPKKVLIGLELTKGMSAGGYVEVGRQAAEEAKPTFKKLFANASLVFITCGMGGGTGTGASPVIASFAKEQGALVIGVITMPFKMEKARIQRAREGLEEMRKNADSVVVVDNNRLLALVPDMPIDDAFSVSDEVLARMVKGVIETIMLPSMVNLDFADIKAVLSGSQVAMVGIGESNAKDRAAKAMQQAISCPLLGDIDYSDAKGVLVHVSGGSNMTISEVHQIGEFISSRVHADAHVIWGARVDPGLGDAIRVILIVNGVRSPHLLLGPASDGGVYKREGPSAKTMRAPLDLELKYF